MREPITRSRAEPERTRTLAVFAGCLLLVGAGFALVSCGGDGDSAADTTTQTTTESETTTEPTTPPGPAEVRVRVVDGAPRGGIVREAVDKGERVVVIVTSNVSDHVHVHGYDRFADVGPGTQARIAFRARLAGRFVIELEDRHAQIAELTVNP